MNTSNHPTEIFVNFTEKGPRFYYWSHPAFRLLPVKKAEALASIDAGAQVYEKTTGRHWLEDDLKVLIQGQ